VTANHAFETMFGWARGELIGHSIETLMPAAFRRHHKAHRAKYFTAPQPRRMGGGLNLVGERKDGSTFPIEVSLNHVGMAGDGRAFAFVTDITERQERTAELERRTAQLSRLASDLTLAEHHAREQIAKTLHDGLQQILVSAALDLDRRIGRDAQQQGDVHDDLLLQIRGHIDEAIEAARSLSLELFPPVLHSSGLPAALRWLANQTRHKYSLAVDVSADPLANSDRKDVRTLLFESVRELLFNAVKHARVDRVSVSLQLDSEERLCIIVEDRGVGFDPAELVERGSAGQIGWGLFSIRERLTLLGGRFDIESGTGQGTRFRLIAPRGAAHVAVGPNRLTESTPARVPGAPGGSPPARPLRILIVDDHSQVRKVFRSLLEERQELRVVGDASDGLEAIAQAHSLSPDAILMDVSMPGMDGVEATRRIRLELPFVEILGLSMQPRTDDVHPIEQAGAAGFYTKGLETQPLIERLLAMHRRIAAEAPVGRESNRA
jgi:PAS domain S-box-containing protein